MFQRILKMKAAFFFLGILAGLTPLSFAALETSSIEYRDGGTLLEGYLAYDSDLPGKRPGILVVPEWTGLGDYAKSRAVQLAELGYVAFAVDMYGKGIFAEDHTEAAKLAGVYRKDRNLMRGRAKAALEILKQQPKVDTENLAAIGYCFGGTTVLEMARAGFPLKGVVSFHGGLGTPVPAEPGAIQAKIMIMNGAQDRSVTPEIIQAFHEEMNRAGADWAFASFGGAVHSFTVPTAGDDPASGRAYNPAAVPRSWSMMKLFFNEIFS